MVWAWVGRVLKGCTTLECAGFGLERSLKAVEPRNGFEFGLEGSLKVGKPENGLGSGWKGTSRPQNLGIGWVKRVLQGCRTMEWVELERSFKAVEPWDTLGLGWKGP